MGGGVARFNVEKYLYERTFFFAEAPILTNDQTLRKTHETDVKNDVILIASQVLLR